MTACFKMTLTGMYIDVKISQRDDESNNLNWVHTSILIKLFLTTQDTCRLTEFERQVRTCRLSQVRGDKLL